MVSVWPVSPAVSALCRGLALPPRGKRRAGPLVAAAGLSCALGRCVCGGGGEEDAAEEVAGCGRAVGRNVLP